MRSLRLLIPVLLLVGAVTGVAQAAPAPAGSPTPEPAVGLADPTPLFLPAAGCEQGTLPVAPIFMSGPLNECEQTCLRNEARCNMRCYRTCGVAQGGEEIDQACGFACEQNCAWASNACMCDCGSDLCNP